MQLRRHMDIRKHFRKHLAHEVIQNGGMLLVRVPTASQLAGILTKGLHCPQWQACVEGILGKTFEPTKGTFVLNRGRIAPSSYLNRIGFKASGPLKGPRQQTVSAIVQCW